MLKINRIKAVSITEDGNYAFDYKLHSGLNLISSQINTRGKSSAILAIYYCLGFEEIIGGRGMKTLTSVYKNVVKDSKDHTHDVLESEVWLEMSNGKEVVTLMRSAKMIGRNENLISVHYCNMESVGNPGIYVEDMYVHAQRSTTSEKGFHNFLEKFIGFELPLVPTGDGNEYKLYMQLLFSVMFIEQKRGWADLFSAMPILNIKDAKKRVVEYLLSLDTLANEKRRVSLKNNENIIQANWKLVVSEIQAMCNRENCQVQGLSPTPRILDEKAKETLTVSVLGSKLSISDELAVLEKRKEDLIGITPKVVDNYEILQEELHKTEESIAALETELLDYQTIARTEKEMISKFSNSLETINDDLRNNKDALKLKQMGSTLDISSYQGICPVCHQTIQDSLLPAQICEHIMSIEENIKHLESQRDMLNFALKAHREKRVQAEEHAQSLSGRIFTLRRLAKTIRNDLYSVDENLSETVVYKRIQLEEDIRKLTVLEENVSQKFSVLSKLSKEWKNYLSDKEKLPRSNFSDSDKEKIRKLDNHFKKYLQAFNYQSVSDFASIQISTETYLPTSEGFDMKFDSSASDNIRAIWAYTLALLHTSIETGGNHPRVIVFDEPAQHSIITADVVSLFNQVNGIPGEKQIILGITLNDGDIRKAVSDFDSKAMHIIDVGNHAFEKIE